MKRITLAVAIASSALSLAAYDLAGSGFTQKGSRIEDGKTIAILADEAGTEVLFGAEDEPSQQRLATLHALVAEIRSWVNFKAATIRAVNTVDRLQVIALPRSFRIGGVALEQAIPGGVQLFYRIATEYDFKVKSGKYLVRVSSVFTGETEMEAAALAAFKDPVAFMAARDPLYVQKRLDDLAAMARASEAKAQALETKAQALDAKAQAFASRFQASEARLDAIEQVTFDVSSDAKEERTSKAEKEIEAVKADLLDYRTKADLRDAAQDATWAKAKPALLASLNGSKPIKEDAMAKLIELKTADPSLDKKNAPKALKAAGFTLSAAEISAIYLVEFGER